MTEIKKYNEKAEQFFLLFNSELGKIVLAEIALLAKVGSDFDVENKRLHFLLGRRSLALDILNLIDKGKLEHGNTL